MKKSLFSTMSSWSRKAIGSIQLRSLSLPKGRFAMMKSTQKCHPEWYTEPAEVQAKRVEGSLATSSWKGKALTGSSAFLVALSLVLFTACGEKNTTEKIVEVATGGTEIVESVKDLPKCTKNNQGEQAYVKGEPSARICVDGKWFAAKESAKDTVFMAGDTVYLDGGNFSCTTKELKDKSGLKIICNGDSIGVVLNGAKGEQGVAGKDGADGEQGIQGEKGDTGEKGDPGAAGKDGKNGTNGTNGTNGKDGTGCTLAQKGTKVTITCGEKSTTIDIGSGSGSVVDTVELDSEKVSVSLDSVSGVSQKGPFLSGSKVQVKELESGRTLAQTGNNFDGKILNDKGEFRIPSRMMVSQYMMLEASGYYRNEVTGEESKSPLTLFGVTNVLLGNVVNINLLTHLEYERVIYLVVHDKMTVRQAKEQAQKEIFGLLDIDATGFSNSERLSIAGSSDEDGALLAFSIMFQGDRSVAQLTELLTKISTDMEKDGTWDDAKTRMDIADWSADADSSGRLAKIRNNVASWGLSAMVPNFEQYIRHFWTTEYGLDSCNAKNSGVVKAATAGKRKGSKTRYICKDADGLGDMRWVIASDFEKDTYQWKAGKDGAVKVGSVTETKYYLYDAVSKEWRDASVVEQKLGGCIESVAADISKNTGFVNGYWYKCEERNWVKTTAYIVDTQGWVPGSDGDVQKGDSTDAYYVFDLAENQWRDASDNDVNLGLMGCTTNRTGEMGRSKKDKRYYSCASDHVWMQMVDKVAYNTIDYDCDKEGKMVTGIVDTKTYFVCDAGIWREATTNEEQEGMACTAAMNGVFNEDSTRICENSEFRDSHVYDFEVGVKDYFNPEVEYGTLKDERDGRTYKTVTINGMTIMAENLNYADEGAHSYLIGNNWCFNNDSTNCLKGGRYYTWTAAVDIDSKWQGAALPVGTIKTPHQGICPNGWHIPAADEWNALFKNVGYVEQQAMGNAGWKYATNASGYSALPVGCSKNHDVGKNTCFWSVTMSSLNKELPQYWTISAGEAHLHSSGEYKDNQFSVRCIKDDPTAP